MTPNLSRRHWIRYLWGLALTAAATAFSALIAPFISPTNLVMIYLLAVILAAFYLGRGPAVMTSILGVAAFDFFFVHPYFTMVVSDTEYLLTFLGLFAVGLSISHLTSLVREQAEAARQAEILEITDKLQSALLNSISHDLRTPLASITGALSSLADPSVHLDEASRRSLAETARGEADRLNRLVGNLLDMTRLEGGVVQIHREVCDIQDVISSAVEQLDLRLEGRALDIDVPPELPLVSLDFVLISRVLVNVIDNALKYSPAGSPIEIRAYAAGGFLEIAVADRGGGIQPEDLARIFDKFYRAQRPDNITGTGLGLAIGKGIVEAHGGFMAAENRPGGGTVITLALPLK